MQKLSEDISQIKQELMQKKEENMKLMIELKKNKEEYDREIKKLKDEIEKLKSYHDKQLNDDEQEYNTTEFGFIKDAGSGSYSLFISPMGKCTEMYSRNYLKGHKILIVMLYDCTANIYENPIIRKKFLLEPQNKGDNVYLKKAADFYGIDIVVVTNYKDAVTELTKQTISGKCDYYATWVISGLPYDVPLPDGGNQYLVMQFIDCLIQFWNNGGSVVMLADGDPLTFQTNLFLEKIVFPDKTKTQLRFGGNHRGNSYLKSDVSGRLNKPGLFNKSEITFRNFQRPALSRELVEIFEGETISYGPSDKEKYKPFIPFMKDSENGISAYFYPANDNMMHLTGDIIIDGGYTKLFDKMSEKGTFRYLQNIIAWTAQVELKLMRGINPKEYRPDAVIFTLNESQKCTLQKPPIVPNEIINASDLVVLECIDQITDVIEFNYFFISLFNATIQKNMGNSGDSSLKNKFEELKVRLKSSGNYSAQTEKRIDILIGITLGNISNVFNIKSITAMDAT